ncbi:uncharacterized protein BDZ99DRAFT_554904, partial [Mytilinidion resinicola]
LLTVALKDCDGLERWLRDGRTRPSDELYVLHQTNTRSRIQMTVEMFCLLCHALQILPSFIDIATAFGFKISNTDEYFTTCYQRLFRDNDDSSNLTKFTRYDICFNIRYLEEHGRSGLSDPWSFRQMAVYQRHDFPQGRSSCILIQPPSTARETIERLLQASKEQQNRSPLLIHLQLLKICARKWRWYLNYLSDGLRDMKDEITWARITKPQSNAGFDQSQNLEVLRWKLRQARAILESNISVGSSILRHAKDITPSLTRHRPMAIHNHMQLKSELVHYISDLRMHRRKASDLLDSTGSLDLLILKLLDLRNYNVSNKNAAALKNLAEASSIESRLMVQIARHTSHDSRAMKFTSFIAVIFLPATLISADLAVCDSYDHFDGHYHGWSIPLEQEDATIARMPAIPMSSKLSSEWLHPPE